MVWFPKKETNMATKHKTVGLREAQKRAAEIRNHWSPLERVKRMGPFYTIEASGPFAREASGGRDHRPQLP